MSPVIDAGKLGSRLLFNLLVAGRRQHRAGQIRGIPHLTAALIRLRELDKFDDATLLRQQLSAMFVAFLKKSPAVRLRPRRDSWTSKARRRGRSGAGSRRGRCSSASVLRRGVPHLERERTVLADELQNVRAFEFQSSEYPGDERKSLNWTRWMKSLRRRE